MLKDVQGQGLQAYSPRLILNIKYYLLLLSLSVVHCPLLSVVVRCPLLSVVRYPLSVVVPLARKMEAMR